MTDSQVAITVGLGMAIVVTYILGDEGVKDLISSLIALIIIATVYVWIAALLLGGLEVLFWIFTGGVFHFM